MLKYYRFVFATEIINIQSRLKQGKLFIKLNAVTGHVSVNR